MLRGSHPNPAELEDPNIPPETEDLAIIITQFLSPQQFSYVRLKDVMASASLVFQMEQTLEKHCTKDKNEGTYLVNQKVIVLYKPMNPPKLLRGVVKRREDDEYLVWILDYGFTLCCSSGDMWSLPDILTSNILEIKDGSIAYIRPMHNHWSKSCLHDFDKLIENAIHLNFEVVCQGHAKRHFGKLMFKTASQSEVFQDGAEFLVSRKHALCEPCMNISLSTSSSRAFRFELAEINDPMIEARPRVKNIIQLVSSSSNQFSHYPKNNNNLLVELEQEPKYSNLSFDIAKVMGKTEYWSDSSERNLSRPSERAYIIEKALENRSNVRVPISGKLMRNEVFTSNEICVQAALEIPSIRDNQNNEMIHNKSSSLESGLDSVWNNVEFPKRSSSPATSSEASFRTMKNEDQPTLSSYSSEDFLSLESLKSSTESLLSNSLEESPSKGLKSTSAFQNSQNKLETVEATFTSSSAPSSEASLSTLKNNNQANLSYASSDAWQEKLEAIEASSSVKGRSISQQDNLESIYKGLPYTKNNVPSIVQNEFKNSSKAMETKKNELGTRALAVMAHSPQAVHPVSCIAELTFCKEIRKSMGDLNIRTVLPMQMYSWPHLLNGGSLVLVNDCDRGRTWSYLPVLCSSVLSSLQDSAFSRELKLGPMAIVLVDSIGRAKALASNCASLMSSSDTQLIKVVNTHDHSMPACQMMLLNSCGILVTTPDHLLDLMGLDIAMIDPKRLQYFIFDDFDRLQQTTPQALNKVLQKLNALPTGPSMQLILVAQQWHAKGFEKLLKRMARPLALFGNFLEAAMYGGLRLKFSLKNSSMKADLLLQFLAEQKTFKKRTLIYCRHGKELDDLHRVLKTAGRECVSPSEAQNQPHQLLVVSDEFEQPATAVRNIEVLIHFSLPHTWSKFAQRFSVMADQIPNCFAPAPQDKKKQPLLSYLLLDKSNSREFVRLTKFLRDHGFETNGAPWMNFQPQEEDGIPYCPYLLSTGECAVVACSKRHYFIQGDMPLPENPLQQEGTVIRCKLYGAYDPGHMAVWPQEYQTKGSTEWVDAPYPVTKWLAALEMSMGTKQNVHSMYRLGDVCVIHHMGHFKRVKIVDIQAKGSVTVQIMDYGTELMRVNSRHLLQCPEQKFRTLPPLAMDIRLSGVCAGEGKWMNDTTQWVQQSLANISDRQQMQITVDFAMLNVVYAKEVTVVEECPTMRTSVYKLLLRKELLNRGFSQMDSQSDSQLRRMHEQQRKANEEAEGNKENTQLAIRNEIFSENTNQYPSPLKIEPNKSFDIPKISKEKKPEPMTEVGNETKKEFSKIDLEHKELPSTKTINIGTLNENIAPGAGSDQHSTSTEALCNTLMQEGTNSSMFLQSVLEGMGAINENKPTGRLDLKLEDAPQGASQGLLAKPVSQSLLYSTISKGAVRPRVKWHQTNSHVELTIEQQVPEYELCLEGKTLLYGVSTSSPPQHFVLPLLGVVRLVSQKQHGYYLKIKLAKEGTLTIWPTLTKSLYAQKHYPWLTYDVERTEEPSPPEGLVIWERLSRHRVNNDDYGSENGEYNSDDFDSGSESVEIFDDC
ncbi:putative ATP-dependent RNA helicase SoYb isoform X2 [Drosophila kikkawai]|uniref:RNA helicase n=1 Tax=Drosophila kikkawai TaxID=30033 RepID=A0ABM4GQZ8_DROKI|nr:putative ATP-dependent RNA helicase SoYb isoform X2 [Drosophila kikkawai]